MRSEEVSFMDLTAGRQETEDGIPTYWVARDQAGGLLRRLKEEVDRPYRMLYDLTAVDERTRTDRDRLPAKDYTVVYHLLSFERNEDVRIKVALDADSLSIPSVTSIWPAAGWYEREVWDLFGIRFDGHRNLRRILMPETWEGHPLRKDHPARATEMGPYTLPDDAQEREQEALRFRPEEWGLDTGTEESDFLFLNLGPQHPGTHGVLRVVLQLDGETVLDAVPDIGFHHRGAEKMGERQSWHTFIPYTDRIDYLGGVLNNLPYVLAVEKLGGIEVPERAQVIRVMLCELFRIASHLVWYGTFAQDVGALSPVFYMFTDRERIFDIVEAICGGRMHPSWFRIGGVGQELPRGWDDLIRDFLAYLPKRLDEYDRLVMRNRIFKARTKGIGTFDLEQAIEWGQTGPGLRACGFEWDFRKKRPYSGYENFDFEIPIAQAGDCYARSEVRVEEMRQSLRIIRQCVENMPEGPVKSDHPLATPPRKPQTMEDIETLIHHFLGVSWGPVIPAGEAFVGIEASKGNNGYYLISDGGVHSYRTRIRAPSFAHMQMLPLITRGHMVPDVLAILGAMDFVLADVDR
ncbi:MAG: NADH-quinone oxidoreductase subunit C/D [Candidatus Eisenbacteria bacterium]|nr:NADH-quinone oxidoreductase subunit C/D [Candidatus Latescibacterota bacterium]MBD3302479.1 NADH-quinone oxidoreductase subunit C/D [Candidatus Eisenbacteria bacterium]